MEHTDQELMGRFRRSGDKDAQQELIRRHLDMVYSAALRLVRDRHLAEDVTQAVFIIFAEKARSFPPEVVPAGWLHRTTRYAALNAMKSKSRRERYEQLASRPERVEDSAAIDWEELAPHVDEALASLRCSYRDAILLRFFRGMSFNAVGQSLGVSEEAARKLVERGVSQLRAQLASRDLSCNDVGLAAALATGAVHAAPAHLAQLVLTTAATGAGAGAAAADLAPLIKGTIAMMTWTKANIAIAAIALALVIGGGATTIAYTAGAFSTAPEHSALVARPAVPPSRSEPALAPSKADVGPADAATSEQVRKTMAAVMNAAASADAEEIKRIWYVDPNLKLDVADATLQAMMAGKKLRESVVKKLGPVTEVLETCLPGGPAVFREQYIPQAQVMMDGGMAIVQVSPTSVPQAVAFRKVDGQWRLDVGATFAPTPAAGEQYLARLRRAAAMYAELSGQIASGECESQDEAAGMISEAMQ